MKIKDLKYQDKRAIAGQLGRRMAKLRLPKVDLIVPVPIDAVTRRRRGFNQAFLIAEALGKARGWVVRRAYLSKCRKTIPQSVLPPKRRAANVRGCFVGRKLSLKGKRVLLVDDMVASGSTLDDAARALKRMGAAKVYAVVAAKSANYGRMREVIEGKRG